MAPLCMDGTHFVQKSSLEETGMQMSMSALQHKKCSVPVKR